MIKQHDISIRNQNEASKIAGLFEIIENKLLDLEMVWEKTVEYDSKVEDIAMILTGERHELDDRIYHLVLRLLKFGGDVSYVVSWDKAMAQRILDDKKEIYDE